MDNKNNTVLKMDSALFELENKTEIKELSSVHQVRTAIREKLKEDLFRFRTCCADPRASK